MLQKHDRPDDRMEALLRLWGAEQASREQDLPSAPPVLKPVRLDLRYALLCTACVAAGAIVAIGALLLAQHSGTKLGKDVSDYVAKAPPLDDALVEPPQPGETDTPQAVPGSDAARLTMEKKIAELESQRDQAIKQAAKADTQKKQILIEKAELERQVHQVHRMKDAVAQLDRKVEALRKEQDAALAMANRLRKQLATYREQHQAKYQQMLEVYLTAVAPNEQGLSAIQTAVRMSSLLSRCANLRVAAQSEETRRLLDRIEVVLLRLDFLDTNDVPAIIRLEHQLRRSDLLADIAAALPGASDNRNLQIFLGEVDLILSGVQRVG